MTAAEPSLPPAPEFALLTLAQRFVWLRRPDVRGGQLAVDEARLCDFLYWWYTHGISEYPAFAASPTPEQYRALIAPVLPATQQAPPISQFLARLWRERGDLLTVYPLDSDAGRRGFVEWIVAIGRGEVPIQDLWIDRGLREWLLSADADLGPAPRLAIHLWKMRPDLQKAYDLGIPEQREGLRQWLWAQGIVECKLGWLVEEQPEPGRYRPPASFVPCATPGREPASEEWGVNLVGFATAEFGLGEALRQTAKAFEAAEIPFSVFEVAASPGVHCRDRSVARWISNRMPYRTSILCMAAFEAADFYLRCGREAFAGRHRIGYWQWELPRWPPLWASAFELVDEVWAPSRHTQAAFAADAPVPVLHMPLAVDLPRTEPQPRARFALADGVFQFLLVFDWNSWPARKNPEAALAAFQLAFPEGDEPVGLAVKMIGQVPWSADFAALKAHAEQDSRITLLVGTFERRDLAALYQCCDAYVSLHRAEGFGYTVAEAMLAGKPVIATNWSGNTDFLDAETGCPVDFELRPIETGAYPYAEGQLWAEPDIRSAAEWMRWLAADWARAAALGRAARERIGRYHGAAAAGARYAERLRQLWRPTAGGATAPSGAPARRVRRKAAVSG